MEDLYPISYQYKQIEDDLRLMVEDGHIDDTCMTDTLKAIGDSLEDETINLCKSIKNREAEVAALSHRNDEIKERLKRSANKVKKLEQTIDYLKTLVARNLEILGHDVDTPDFRARFVGKKQSVELVGDIDDVDPHYIITETRKNVDKKSAYDPLKAGQSICGLKLGDGKRLEIK